MLPAMPDPLDDQCVDGPGLLPGEADRLVELFFVQTLDERYVAGGVLLQLANDPAGRVVPAQLVLLLVPGLDVVEVHRLFARTAYPGGECQPFDLEVGRDVPEHVLNSPLTGDLLSKL